MYSRINYTMVGLFVLILGIGATIFGFWLAKYGFEQKYDYFVLYFEESVDGLNVDSSVKLNGVDVGKIVNIEVMQNEPNKSRVLIKVKANTPITTSMYATLKPQGITGLSYINITGAKEGDKILKGGTVERPTVIPVKKSLIYQLQEKAPDIVDKLSNSMDKIDRLLSDKNIHNIEEILQNINYVTKRVKELSKTLQSSVDDINKSVVLAANSVDRAGDSFDRMSRELSKTAKDINQRLPLILNKFDRLSVNLSNAVSNLNKSIKRGDYNFRDIIEPIRIDIDELSYKYKELADDLKNLTLNPSKALFGGATIPNGPGE